LLQPTRAGHGEQAGDGEFAVRAAVAKHDLAPLHRGTERTLRGGMPRAGLCRVRRESDAVLGAELGFGFFGVSA
jgi:hypothetical protein